MKNYQKYKPGYYPVGPEYTDWVKKDHIEKAPIWCSVDLRDGNQALIVPMSLDQKIEFFQYLCKLGFKEIEVGFPAASDTEFNFLRALIDQDLIPDDVTIQVLTQSRQHIIDKTFESLKGIKGKVIVHLYNSTSFAQRQQVFRKPKNEIIDIAKFGANYFNQKKKEYPDIDFQFEYSPESFTGTEMDFAAEICNEVIDIWDPKPGENPVIINCPATVEMSLPHVYANQICYMDRNLHNRENVVLSVHPHNDRGTGVAITELALLAGADRVEGTLFGNGERTGNVDIVNVALNMYTHGVDPKLDFSNIPDVVEHYEKYTNMPVDPRHPYSGELVFAAFSGSHQDAIAKGMHYRKETGEKQWTCPYIPIDPHDIGREYEGDVIRINSQSGKGGVSYILERDYGYQIPKEMRPELGHMMTSISDQHHEELKPEKIFEAFSKEYINNFKPLDITDATFHYNSSTREQGKDSVGVDMHVIVGGKKEHDLTGKGNGRMDAVSNALSMSPYHINYKFITYSENALSGDSNSKAAAYVCIEDQLKRRFWGVGLHDDIISASVNALVSAINRMNQVDHIIQEEN
ncbi:MAG: 2-isopropylmalate synthase [Eubacteriales bacterium]|nr:2-isopropylmalate synthase [Eubacteriales bacterium]